MSKKLHLTIARKWFTMIALGIKKEEYREIKPHWTKRIEGKEFDTVVFWNGTGHKFPQLEIELHSIGKGFGRQEWGAEGYQRYYVLKLGKILSEKNFVRSSDGNIWFEKRKRKQ